MNKNPDQTSHPGSGTPSKIGSDLLELHGQCVLLRDALNYLDLDIASRNISPHADAADAIQERLLDLSDQILSMSSDSSN